MKVLVLGAGVVGQAVAWDMVHTSPAAVSVTMADIDPNALERVRRALPVTTASFDARSPSGAVALAADADVVVGALPSRVGFEVMRVLCRAGARYCDVSFMHEDAATLGELARTNGACVVYDCGVAPGLSHVLVGAAAVQLARVETVRIDVGGVPEQPLPPYYYKAPFAASDVIEEYTRPVRVLHEGQQRVVVPLTGVETVEIDGVGRLDSFLTDGLRSLVTSIGARHMEERTLRHHGHLAAMLTLRTGGFFDPEPVDVLGQMVSPRAVTSALLFRHWAYDEGERDVTVLRVQVTGVTPEGHNARHEWLLVDRPDSSSTGALSSMARTTAFPAAIVARWLAAGQVSPGVHAPEALGLNGQATALLDALRLRGVRVASV